jgi:hypothetical protein
MSEAALLVVAPVVCAAPLWVFLVVRLRQRLHGGYWQGRQSERIAIHRLLKLLLVACPWICFAGLFMPWTFWPTKTDYPTLFAISTPWHWFGLAAFLPLSIVARALGVPVEPLNSNPYNALIALCWTLVLTAVAVSLPRRQACSPRTPAA